MNLLLSSPMSLSVQSLTELLLRRLASFRRVKTTSSLPQVLTAEWLLSAGALSVFLQHDHCVYSIISSYCVKKKDIFQLSSWLTTPNMAPRNPHLLRSMLLCQPLPLSVLGWAFWFTSNEEAMIEIMGCHLQNQIPKGLRLPSGRLPTLSHLLEKPAAMPRIDL